MREVAGRFLGALGALGARDALVVEPAPEHETAVLAVDSTRARTELGWTPHWSTEDAVDRTAAWHRHFLAGCRAHPLVVADLEAFEASP